MKTALISLEELYLFVRVAKSHFINLVAKEEGMTPSAVSQAIFRLEKDVGFELFQRESRPLKLIAAGKRLLEEAPKLLLTAKELPLKLKNHALSEATLRLGISESVTATMAPWVMKELSQKVGTLNTASLLTKPLVEALRSDQFDVAIMPDPLLQEERWYRKAVYVEDFLLVYGKGLQLPCVEKEERSHELMAALSRAPFIGYSHEGSSDARAVEQILLSMELNPAKHLEASSSYALVGLVGELGGWSIIPATNFWCGRQFIEKCHALAIPSIHATRTMWVVTDKARYEEDPRLAQLVENTVRHVMQNSMYPELKKVSKELLKHCRLVR